MSDIAALVADSLDIWTGAIERKSGAGRGGGGKRISLYGIERLRALILDLAVRGKLVPQNDGDEPAQVLFRRICLSNDHGLPKARFNIPAAWRWVKLGQIATFRPGRTPSRKEGRFWGGDHSWVSIADMEDGETLDQTAETISDLATRSVFRNDPSPVGSILMSFKLTIGKISRLAIPAYHNEAIVTVSPSVADLDPFLFLVLPSCARAGISRNAIKGATLNSKSIFEISIPLPPLAEQRRIVAKVDELMALCDALEQESAHALAAHQVLVETILASLVNSSDAADLSANWTKLESHFDTLFTTEASIDALKQTILDLAVRGKLAEQDGGDESAPQAIKRTQKLKQELILKRELRKDKLIPPVSVEDAPFHVPCGWLWCRIGKIALSTEYGTSRKAATGGSGVTILAMGNIQGGVVNLDSDKTIPHNSEELPDLLLRRGDILYNRTNSYELVGKTGIFRFDTDDYSFASYLIRIRLDPNSVEPEFLNIAMNTPYFRQTQVVPKITKQTGQANVSGGAMRSMLVPIPPLAEQHRIVAKVDELIALCDVLKARLAEAVETHRDLADAIVERAVA